jgi:hypothetical protein
MKTKFATFIIIGILLASCSQVTHMQENGELHNQPLNLPYLRAEKGKTWLEFDPDQCGMRDPWSSWDADETQSFWNNCQSKCRQIDTRGKRSKCIYDCVLREGHSSQGIEVFDVKVTTFEEKFGSPRLICEACDCPAGVTVYVLVADHDVEAMLGMGYRHVVKSCGSATPGADPYGCP